MKSNHRLILIDRIDFGEVAPEHRRTKSISELNQDFYDLRINIGLYAHVSLTSKSREEIGEFLSKLKENGIILGNVYVCQSKNIFSEVM